MLRIIFLAVSLLVTGATAHAETPWTNWGSAPYATSQEEAFRLLPEALVALGIPEEIHEQFIEQVRTNPQGQEIFLDPSDRLIAMMTGGVNPHAMFDVPVAAIPVGGDARIVQAARARKWEYEYEGVTYVLILPEVCFNFSYMTHVVQVREVPVPTPVEVAPPPEECAMIIFPAEEGWAVRNFFLSEQSRLPTSNCWALLEGIDNEAGARVSSLPGRCDQCNLEDYLRWARREHGLRGSPVNSARYNAERGNLHAVIIPISQIENYNTICVGPDERRQRYSPVTVEPSDWDSSTLRETPFVINLSQDNTIAVTHQFQIQPSYFEVLPRRRTWLWWN